MIEHILRARRLLVLCTLIGVLFPITYSVSSASSAQTDDPPTIGVLTGSQSSYRSAVSGLKSSLEAGGLRYVVGELPKGESNNETVEVVRLVRSACPRLVVGVGLAATNMALRSWKDIPVLFCMVPNVQDQSFGSGGDAGRLGGVTTDIDPSTQVAWMLRLCPSLKRVGALCSERTSQTFSALYKAGQTRQVEMVGIRADKEQFAEALKELSGPEIEGVMMLPDASVYNSANVRALLVWAIRQKKPVFTFSDNLVKAGALTGQYADAEAVGRQTGQWVCQVVKGQTDGRGVRYPSEVLTAVNERTAELIGLLLEESVLNEVTKRYGKDE